MFLSLDWSRAGKQSDLHHRKAENTGASLMNVIMAELMILSYGEMELRSSKPVYRPVCGCLIFLQEYIKLRPTSPIPLALHSKQSTQAFGYHSLFFLRPLHSTVNYSFNTPISLKSIHQASPQQCLFELTPQDSSTTLPAYGTAAIARTTPVTTPLYPNVTIVVTRDATPANPRGIDQGGDQVPQYWDGIWNSANKEDTSG